jgi:hypothetical protein
MKRNFTFILLILLFLPLIIYSQEVGFDIGFSPYDTSTSSVTIKFKEDYIDKILSYFKNKSENFFVENSSNTQFQRDINSGEFKKIFYGFGKKEIIRLILIYEKTEKNVSLKNLSELRKKGKTIKELADRYNVNYEEIWLESKRIYDEIFGPKDE